MRLSIPPSHAPLCSSARQEDEAILLFAELLIPGRGQPIKDGGIAMKGAKIEWVGAFSDRPSEYRDIQPTCVPVLMPGLWDCHVHFLAVDVAQSLSDIIGFLPQSPVLAGAITVDDFRRTLMSGYTTVRELGGYGCDVSRGVALGALVGPNVYSAVGPITPTGGHSDIPTMPSSTVEAIMAYGSTPLAVADGVDGCTKTVRSMVRRGAKCIKVTSSGGIVSLADDPEDRQFSDAELSAIVEEAGRSRRAVAAHAIGKAGIMAALRAGVKSIEHGMYLDEEVADAMVAADAIYVPTQHVLRVLTSEYRNRVPPVVLEKALAVMEQSKKAYKIALRKKVKFALGTDMVSSDPSSIASHGGGNNANELVYAVELGMTPLQAIECATANAPEVLGGLAPLSGQLKEGYDADVIALSHSPLRDVAALTNTDNITHVWKGGKLFKGPS